MNQLSLQVSLTWVWHVEVALQDNSQDFAVGTANKMKENSGTPFGGPVLSIYLVSVLLNQIQFGQL